MAVSWNIDATSSWSLTVFIILKVSCNDFKKNSLSVFTAD